MKAELFFVITVIECVVPMFIKSGFNFIENNGQSHGGSFRDIGGKRIEGNLQNSEGNYNDGKFNSVNSQDGSRFAESAGAKVSHLDQNGYHGNMYQQGAGRQDYEVMKNIGHRKGHHKSGFHKSYCKDESGNNSSYYDDGHDEGNQYVYDGRNKNYDGSSSYQQKNQNFDAGYYNKDKGVHKLYDNKNNIYNDRGDNAYYNRKYYDNDGEFYGQHKDNDLYGRDGYFTQNRYYDNPYYTGSYDHSGYDNYPSYSVQSWSGAIPTVHFNDIYDEPHYGTDEYSRTYEYDRHSLRPYYGYGYEYYLSKPDASDYHYY
ncbi:hypothetical protein WA026_015548 [Henosepilachna vigintioctopunctata]|uniref:Uncharacterized protein n=1 Tax=Henosepilachna vigintioctopunctata TaxID=420089 RepID=A0AAW1VFZ7_9CUCU